MDFLKRENWWLCLLLNLLTGGIFYLVLAKLMDLYDKDAWYHNKWYWIFGTLCLVFPAFIMLMVFMIQMNSKVAANLELSGSSIYNTPYTWILFIIIPVLGWTLLIVMYTYIFFMPHYSLLKGKGEKFIK